MEIPNADLTPDDIEPGASLTGADLSEANLYLADLSGADLQEADLSGAILEEIDLSEANLYLADLSEANLYRADLSGANLRDANLSGTNLFEVNLSGVALSWATQIEPEFIDIKEMASQLYGLGDSETPGMWDAVARMNHELKTAYSANGLVGQARKYRVRERLARRNEAKAEGGLTGYSAWLGSLLSRIVTGYGVQLRWVGTLMLLIYLVSAAVYWRAGMEVGESLYYSIVTFTTAPPAPPPSGLITQVTAMGETFGGTLLIVLLGYVLGNREQV